MSSGDSGITPTKTELTNALIEVCNRLAKDLIADAEGHTKIVEIVVAGADSESDALEVGRAVARNNLLKCAINGEDPNWGRILAAVGTTSARFDPLDVDVAINRIQVCRSSGLGEDRELVDMSGKHVRIEIELKIGVASATVWTNDLSAMYVHENSAYST
jgi:glutamate N-acetyltransferase/amino-acid N-acetyltransferase